jgi:hypothetical protein
MSSEHREPAQMPANKLYVNIAAINSTIFDGSGVAAANIMPWVTANATASGQLATAGSAILRDMGKTVYLPAGSTSAMKSTVLRKVQLVTAAGTSGADADGYLTGFIEIGGLTYGGGNGVAAKVARLN